MYKQGPILYSCTPELGVILYTTCTVYSLPSAACILVLNELCTTIATDKDACTLVASVKLDCLVYNAADL